MAIDWMQKKSVRIALGIGTLLAAAGLGYYLWKAGLLEDVHDYVKQTASLPLFFVLLALLPVVGFPLSLLLVVAGARLGIVWGIAALVVAIPLHLFLTWLLSRSLKRRLQNYFERREKDLPQIPDTRRALWVAMFSLVPGLSYGVKNFTIALGGASLGLMLAVAWPVQIIQCIPLVLVGGAVATGSLTPLFIGLFLLLVAIIGTPRLVRAIRGKDESESSSTKTGNQGSE